MHNLADASKEAGLKHCVFSSLDYCTKVLEEKGITSIPKIGKYWCVDGWLLNPPTSTSISISIYVCVCAHV